MSLMGWESPFEATRADAHKYLIHDRDSIFARHLDDSIRALGLAALRSPFSSPKANATCERLIGTIRRECLDWMIPLSEAHLRSISREWVADYNGGRPHSALGPGVPGPRAGSARTSKAEPRRLWAPGALVVRNPCWAACTTSTRFRGRHWVRRAIQGLSTHYEL